MNIITSSANFEIDNNVKFISGCVSNTIWWGKGCIHLQLSIPSLLSWKSGDGGNPFIRRGPIKSYHINPLTFNLSGTLPWRAVWETTSVRKRLLVKRLVRTLRRDYNNLQFHLFTKFAFKERFQNTYVLFLGVLGWKAVFHPLVGGRLVWGE